MSRVCRTICSVLAAGGLSVTVSAAAMADPLNPDPGSGPQCSPITPADVLYTYAPDDMGQVGFSAQLRAGANPCNTMGLAHIVFGLAQSSGGQDVQIVKEVKTGRIGRNPDGHLVPSVTLGVNPIDCRWRSVAYVNPGDNALPQPGDILVGAATPPLMSIADWKGEPAQNASSTNPALPLCVAPTLPDDPPVVTPPPPVTDPPVVTPPVVTPPVVTPPAPTPTPTPTPTSTSIPKPTPTPVVPKPVNRVFYGSAKAISYYQADAYLPLTKAQATCLTKVSNVLKRGGDNCLVGLNRWGVYKVTFTAKVTSKVSQKDANRLALRKVQRMMTIANTKAKAPRVKLGAKNIRVFLITSGNPKAVFAKPQALVNRLPKAIQGSVKVELIKAGGSYRKATRK